MEINRVWAMPNKNTFSIKPIGELVKKYLSASSVSVDPFARNTSLATYTNDLDPNTSAEYHLYAQDFLAELVEMRLKADLIILDPPYSPRQIKECYDGIGIKMQQNEAMRGAVFSQYRSLMNQILTDDGIVLWFGWNTNGMGKKYNFEIVEILLVAHGSDHNDTICMVERRISP